MIPKISSSEIVIDKQPSQTFDFNGNIIDGLKAIEQAIYLILNIQRYQYLVYSFNYGFEYVDLIGKDKYFIMAELESRITEALTQDDRILSVSAFLFENVKDRTSVNFKAQTVYGEIEIERLVV